jgi:polyribonucleotide 5'-hydroxyl-kinase
MASDGDDGIAVQTFTLEQEQELRVETPARGEIKLKLVDGTAEVFGAEIAVGQSITCVSGRKLAVFTYHGATIEVRGEVEIAYVAGETPMVSYANTHSVLNAKRVAAASENSSEAEGPRVMCVGPTDVGKSTVYFYGDLTVNNPDYYKHIVSRLGTMLDERSKANEEARAAGCVVNTMGWIDGVGLELLLHAREALKIDHVLVIGQERLFGQLQQKLKGTDCQVFRLQKSGGVVERTPEYRRASRDRMFKEYFYGATGELAPASQTAYFSKISIYRIGGGPRAPTSALPIGQAPSTDPMRVTPVVPSTSLLHSVLAVSHGKTQGDLLTSNVAGFIYITEVNMMQKSFTYLSPCPGELPSNVLLSGNLKWLGEDVK